jgi:hypothetical protein
MPFDQIGEWKLALMRELRLSNGDKANSAFGRVLSHLISRTPWIFPKMKSLGIRQTAKMSRSEGFHDGSGGISIVPTENKVNPTLFSKIFLSFCAVLASGVAKSYVWALPSKLQTNVIRLSLILVTLSIITSSEPIANL